MASGKRASMREGPLADLFRRTDESAKASDQVREEAEGQAKDADDRVPAPSTPAARERRAPESPPPPPRDTGYPHPSLGATTPEARPAPEPHVPTPQERLRHAFSADIPDNILDRQPDPRRDAGHDPYSRVADEPVPWGTAIGRAS